LLSHQLIGTEDSVKNAASKSLGQKRYTRICTECDSFYRAMLSSNRAFTQSSLELKVEK
jgi:hypothetical protein